MIRAAALFLFILISSCSPVIKPAQVKIEHPSSFREIFDRHGELLHETRINFKSHRRSWTKLEDIPIEIQKEIVLLEDQRFLNHPGVDVIALLNAVQKYPRRGGSTITMQLAGILDGHRKRSIVSKLSQMKTSLHLEMNWSKEEILEAWLNLLSFRGDIEGIRAASLGLFNKNLKALNKTERVLLYALIPGPNQSQERILARGCRYLERLNSEQPCSELASVLESSYFKHPLVELQEHHAPHLATKFKKENAEAIMTTIDKRLQIEASQLLRSHISNLRVQHVNDGAVLIWERKTGEVRAYVGSSGDYSKSSLVDHIQSPRQAGSTLKPLLFAQAISERLITMTTPLRDEPFSVTREGLTYQPENYQKGFTYQDVPAKMALGSSLNIPAVRVIDYVTPEKFYSLLSNLEFRDLQEPEYYGHSMALGSVDITLWDLTRSYGALAEAGNFINPVFKKNIKLQPKNIPEFSEDVSYIISSILSEKNNRSLTFGIQSTLSTDSWSAVKTGTSKDMRDNWCVGYTDKYVIGVWVGNSGGDPMWNVTGITGAAPIFSQLVSSLHAKKSSAPPSRPLTLITVGEDLYIKGTEPKNKIALSDNTPVTKILFPQQGAQFAFDPEIPENSQRILFQASGHDLRWKMNGIEIKKSEIEKGFYPSKSGKYRLQLLDEKEQTKDEISFYVKSGKI